MESESLPPPLPPLAGVEAMEEDAADREARLRAEEAARKEAEFKKQSSVVQRGLPRPVSLQLLPTPLSGDDLAAAGES